MVIRCERKKEFYMTIKELTLGIDDCTCGKKHSCPISAVEIGSGAINTLNELCSEYSSILLVSDENTYRVCGADVYAIITDKVKKNLVLHDNGDVVIPNEEKIAEIEAALPAGCDLIVGVGSGVINDLCKHVSHKNGLPYYIVATAPSMDGYASVGSALILEGMKVTLNARPPKAIIADTRVLKDAPMDMIRAGYGDIIGKFSCLNDWKLSALINGEYFCQRVYDLTYDTAMRVKKMAGGVAKRDEETIGALMEALVVVGIAMSYVDCSRPASGSEHHLSHFFEITGILDGKEYFAHGIDVAYSAVETAKVRAHILNCTPVFRPVDKAAYEKEIKRIYTSAADGVIALQNKLGWYDKDDSATVLEKWDQIKAILAEAPTPCEFIEMLEAVGLSYGEFEKLYGEKKIADAVLYGKDLKDRYSVLWLNFMYFRKNPIDKNKVKVIAFDLDGTLTQHKTKLSDANRATLKALSEKYRLVMVGAGTCPRIFNQLDKFPIDVIGNYGLQYGEYNKETGELDIKRDIVFPVDRESVDKRITALREKYGFTEFAGENTEFHPSGCVTFPILGTKAQLPDKLAFDPDRKKRRAILADVKATFPEYIVFVGGSSSFDMAPAPYDKAYALDLYCREHGIAHDEAVFVGDDYGMGGNDEAAFLTDFGSVEIDDYTAFPEKMKFLL